MPRTAVALAALAAPSALALAALALGGCFSADDFARCPNEAACLDQPGTDAAVDSATPSDLAVDGPPLEPDVAIPDPPDVASESCPATEYSAEQASGTLDCPGRTVTLVDLTTRDPDGSHLTVLEVFAARIVIRGRLDAKGAGFRGGGGGGAGGGATTAARRTTGGEGGAVGTGVAHVGGGAEGAAGSGGRDQPGAGGPGGRGGGGREGSGAAGTAGQAAGEPGADGVNGFHVPAGTAIEVWQPLLCQTTARPGAGGGGGGGGAGGAKTPMICEVAGGGGGGGAGTPGGGALLLHATEEIVIEGVLDVSGGDRDAEPQASMAGEGACGAPGECGATCAEREAAGNGGRGGASGHTGQEGGQPGTSSDGAVPPAPEGSDSGGRGGRGGLGGGGFILLDAPSITWGRGAGLVLAGGQAPSGGQVPSGDGASVENPGVLVVLGEQAGEAPAPESGAFVCPPLPFQSP